MSKNRGLISGKSLIVLLFFSSLFFGCEKEELFVEEDSVPEENEQIEPVPFSVMSFNIRHDDVNDPQSLEERKFHILNIIKENTPDIVGLQEFSNDWFEAWMEKEMTSMGYGHYIDAVAGRGTPKAIFYKRDRFRRKGQATFEMNFTQGRSGTWVILEDAKSGSSYFISNSHWTTSSSADRVKTAEKVVSELGQNFKGLPLVVFGDFNAKPGTPEIKVLENSKTLNIKNADEALMRTFHGWDAVGNSKLDWIFYSAELELLKSEVIRTSYDGFWPSDHWPIMSTFQLND